MIKNITSYTLAAVVSFACLGLLTLWVARDMIKDLKRGSFD
jgi:hypothetical protein